MLDSFLFLFFFFTKMDQCQSNHKRVNGVIHSYRFYRLLKVRRKNFKTSLTLFEKQDWLF